jgi:hypothetical protein
MTSIQEESDGIVHAPNNTQDVQTMVSKLQWLRQRMM